MASKKRKMDRVIIGFDEVKDELGSLKHTIMYSKEGNCSAILQIQNPVQQYCCDATQYYAYIDVLKNILQTLGEGYALQKQDILSRAEFHHEITKDMDYLKASYFRHFEDRKYMKIQSFLTITQEFKKSKLLAYDPKKYSDFLSKIDKVCDILKSQHIAYFELNKPAMEEYLYRYIAADFSEGAFSMNNIMATDEFLKTGDTAIKCVPLVDVDDVSLPQSIAPFTTNKTNGFNTPTDLLAFLYKIPYATCIIYNQVFIIPQQRREQVMLERKAKRHASLPDPSNNVAKTDIETVLDIIAREGSMIVHSSNNIIFKAPLNKMVAVNNFIQTKIYENGLGKPSGSAYNQYELFMASCPGCSYNLKDYDLFKCLSDVALCLTFKESELFTEDSPLLVYFTDRNGIPVGIDFTGREGALKLTDNKNFFCLGPSGTGKSFTLNSIVRQLLEQDTEIVMIDVGDSYWMLNFIKEATYITYSKEKPISMNPFNISPVEYKENFGEKKNFLKSLIFLIYKGNEQPSRIEESIINQVLIEYFEAYFNPFQGFSKEERKQIKKEMLLLDKASGEYDKSVDSYMDSSNPGTEAFNLDDLQIDDLEQLDELSDDEREKQEKIMRRANQFRNVINDSAATDGEKEAARNQLVRIMPEIVSNKRYLVKLDKRIEAMEEKRKRLKVPSLSFNTFFEFSIQRIPQIVKESKVQFEFHDYNRLMKRFYKGGEFDTTLNNEVDATLFDEKFIVFEIDKIKDDETLFPIVVLIIMDVFLQKMRIKKCRKALIIEEAWKAISSPTMAGYIKYLYKTVRKFNGIAGVVTQELNDVIDSPIVKEAIIANSDVKILLDQSKYKDKFDKIANVLGLSEVTCKQIFTINSLDNKEGRPIFNEACIIRGQYPLVLGIEEAPECYWAYTTERLEKEAVKIYVNYYVNPIKAIMHLEEDRKKANVKSYYDFALLVNNNNNVMSLWKN